MRKLMWFTIGFTAACVAGVYLVYGKWLWLLGAICLMGMLGVLWLKSRYSAVAVCILFGCAISFFWLFGFDRLYLQPVRTMDGQADIFQIEVTEYSRSTGIGVVAEGKTKIQGKTYHIQFYINEHIDLSPGDCVNGGFMLRYTGIGSANPTYHQGRGIFLLAYPKGMIDAQTNPSVPSRYFAPVLRQKILNIVDTVFPEDTSAFAKALLIGDTQDLSYETVTALKGSGVYHIVAVSGLHVSILVALVCLVCFRRRFLTAIIGIPLLWVFAAVTGLSPSVVRACIMQSLVLLAFVVDEQYDSPTALAVAVLVLLVCNPLTITSISFQLSVGCILGIFLFSERIHNYLLKEKPIGPIKGKGRKTKLIRWAVGSVSVTLSAMLITTPLCALYFGGVSIVGVLTNLLLLWLVSLVFYGIMVACVLGALWLPLGIGIGWILSWPIRIILWVTNMISRVPVSSVYTSSIYIVLWLVFAYVMVVVFVKAKKKHPWIMTSCLALGLIVAIAFSWIEPRMDNFRFTAVDVGQGQCLILQSGGKYYMVDCGGDTGDKAADKASQLLLSQGVFRLDGLIITHYDEDHAGGADQLLSRIPAKKIYMPVTEGDSRLRDELAHKYSEKICWVKSQTQLNDADITIYPSIDQEDANESSLCILFQPADCDILITGDRSFDGEMELIEQVELPDLEIIVAGHHGSKTSTSWELLNETRPDVAIISVGADNRYGHPTWETLERLDLFGCGIYRTDLEGTIIFRG